MGLQRFPFNRYHGGVNLQDGPLSLETYEAQKARNVILGVRNVISQRRGTTKLNGTGFPEGKRAENVASWYHGSTRHLMASIDGDVYSMTTGGTLTERFNGTAATIWDFEDMEQAAGIPRLWMMNGKDTPKKWNGTLFTDWAGEPPKGSMLRAWKNRMIVAGVEGFPTRLFYSEIGDPEAPASKPENGGWGSNWIDIRTSEDDVSPITWIDVIGDVLLIFKKTGTFAIFDPTGFSFRQIAHLGCENRFQSCVLMERCYFFHRSGIYSVTESGGLRYESQKLEPIFNGTHEEFAINFGELDLVRVESTPDRRVMVAIPTGEGAANNLLLEGVHDLAADAKRLPWMLHTLPVASMAIYRQGDVDELVGGDSGDDQLLRFFVGENDDGDPIESEYFSSWQKFLSEEPVERFRRFNLGIEGEVSIEVYADLDSDVPKFVERLETEVGQALEWDDEGVWDDGLPWDPGAGPEFQRVRPETRARYHAVRLLNNELNKSWQISMGEFAFRGGKEHTE